MNSKKNKKTNILYLIIAIVLLIIALLAPLKNIIRLFVAIFSLLTLSLYKFIKLEKNKKFTPLYTLGYLIFYILLDSICVVTMNKLPIFSTHILNDENVRIYNALGYKVWQCNIEEKELIIEPFNENGYLCDVEEIENIPINELITSLNNNYDEYRNRYVKTTGKISKKDGANYIEMQAYEENVENINGEVKFTDTITLAIYFPNYTNELDVYDVHDEITVVGKIKNMETVNDKRIIYMYETKLTSKIELDTYTVTATVTPSENKTSKEKQLLQETLENNIYKYGLDNIIVKYNDNLEYELSSVLSSNKLSINAIIEQAEEEITDKKNPDNKSKLYKFKTFNIIVCNPENSKDIFITSPKTEFDDIECTIVE